MAATKKIDFNISVHYNQDEITIIELVIIKAIVKTGARL